MPRLGSRPSRLLGVTYTIRALGSGGSLPRWCQVPYSRPLDTRTLFHSGGHLVAHPSYCSSRMGLTYIVGMGPLLSHCLLALRTPPPRNYWHNIIRDYSRLTKTSLRTSSGVGWGMGHTGLRDYQAMVGARWWMS